MIENHGSVPYIFRLSVIKSMPLHNSVLAFASMSKFAYILGDKAWSPWVCCVFSRYGMFCVFIYSKDLCSICLLYHAAAVKADRANPCLLDRIDVMKPNRDTLLNNLAAMMYDR